MYLGQTNSKEVTLGMDDKGSKGFAIAKPFITAAFATLILYLNADVFDKTEMISIAYIWAGAFGLEMVNVQPKTHRRG